MCSYVKSRDCACQISKADRVLKYSRHFLVTHGVWQYVKSGWTDVREIKERTDRKITVKWVSRLLLLLLLYTIIMVIRSWSSVQRVECSMCRVYPIHKPLQHQRSTTLYYNSHTFILCITIARTFLESSPIEARSPTKWSTVRQRRWW